MHKNIPPFRVSVVEFFFKENPSLENLLSPGIIKSEGKRRRKNGKNSKTTYR